MHTPVSRIRLAARSARAGDEFGPLKAIGPAFYARPANRDVPLIVVACHCGQPFVACVCELRSGRTTSCGCGKRRPKTHGQAGTRLYRIWCNMRARCYYPKAKLFHRYGGRGITVCAEWRESFEPFFAWATRHGYRDDLQIDRRDNDGHYEPGNCRWVTRDENLRNRPSRKGVKHVA